MNGDSPEAAAIEADIERTREDLAETVDRLTGPDGKPKPVVLAAAGGVVAVLAAALVLRARR